MGHSVDRQTDGRTDGRLGDAHVTCGRYLLVADLASPRTLPIKGPADNVGANSLRVAQEVGRVDFAYKYCV